MALSFLRFLIVALVVTLTLFTVESQGQEYQPQINIGDEDEEGSDLSRRFVRNNDQEEDLIPSPHLDQYGQEDWEKLESVDQSEDSKNEVEDAGSWYGQFRNKVENNEGRPRRDDYTY